MPSIMHVMARGNGRQDIVQDDADRGRLVACLERAVRRSGWSLYAFVFLTNHPLGPPDASPQPRQGHATVPLVVRQWVGSSPPPLRAPLPGPLPDRAGRGRDVSLGPDPLRPSQPRPGRPVRNAGGLDMVELPRLFPPSRSPGLGGLRRVACGLGRRVRTDRSGGILPSLRGGRSDYPACPPVGRGTAWMAPRQ